MSRRKSSNPSDYEVGYGRPPEGIRFQPGQSGNPTGRRKAIPTIGARLRELVYSKVTVTEQGRTRRSRGWTSCSVSLAMTLCAETNAR